MGSKKNRRRKKKRHEKMSRVWPGVTLPSGKGKKYKAAKPVGTFSGDVSADVVVSNDVIVFMTEQMTHSAYRECSGVAVIDGLDIKWIHTTSIGHGGRVDTTENDMFEALTAAIEAGFDTVNAQWHTHPKMGAFWSVTDVESQNDMVGSAMAISPTGEMYFLVIDWGDWLVRKYVWANDQVIYGDGRCFTSGSVKLEMESAPVTTKYLGGYGSYGGWLGSGAFDSVERITGNNNVVDSDDARGQQLIDIFDGGRLDGMIGSILNVTQQEVNAIRRAGRNDVADFIDTEWNAAFDRYAAEMEDQYEQWGKDDE